MKSAPFETKLRLLNKTVLPIASYRMSRWPFQVHAAKRIDRTQTKMIRTLLRERVRPGDDPASFVIRRNRLACNVAEESGWWSGVWRKRVIDWHAHLNREANRDSWAAKTLNFHGKEWLQDRRMMHAVGSHGSVLAGRTCTRAASLGFSAESL